VKPVLQALILAEHVYEDKSGKKVIAGTFNRIIVTRRKEDQQVDDKGRELIEAGGTVAPQAYISLTDVCDDTKLGIQFVSLTLNQVIFETEVTVRCDDRLSSVEIVLPLPRLENRIRTSGSYAFEVVCEGEILGSHRLTAVVSDETQTP